jgi:endonuclease/exonuclease/phosphatase family metal-dependent hydrolase
MANAGYARAKLINPMRVATYNIHDCIGLDEKFDATRIVSVIQEIDADIVALQEITVDSQGELVDLFEQSIGMQAIDGTIFDRGVGRYGNVILTKCPIVDNCLHDISARGLEPRAVIEVTLDIDDAPMQAFATHLGLTFFERRSQLRRLAQLLPERKPALVMGDFNIWGLSWALSPLHKRGYRSQKVKSFPVSPHPFFALDRIRVNAFVNLT